MAAARRTAGLGFGFGVGFAFIVSTEAAESESVADADADGGEGDAAAGGGGVNLTISSFNSASKIVDKSADIGGPGDGVRSTGAELVVVTGRSSSDNDTDLLRFFSPSPSGPIAITGEASVVVVVVSFSLSF